MPSITNVVVPFECYQDQKAELVIVNHLFVNKKSREQPTISLIDCNMQENAVSTFKISNMAFLNANLNNSLEYGQIGVPNKFQLTSDNLKFSLSLSANGNLELRQHDLLIWQNEMGFFANNSHIRLRINEKGHLIEEVQGLFSKTVPNYRRDEWITVWSSAPIDHNTTIGIPFVLNKYVNYKLVLENSGELNMYDAVGALIWCISDDCQHRYGYMFPEVYLVPINFKIDTARLG